MKNLIKTGAFLTPVFLFPACMTEQKENNEKTLNIIHIMTDDHSYQTISAYGHPLSKLAPTPNLDRLASEGILFQKAFVENSLSTPSRACLMTGLYSHQNGQRQLGKGIDTTRIFFSELLQQQGYQTGVVGKWHMQCEPKGFDFYHILWDQGEYYNPEFRSPYSDGKYVKEEGYATTLITDHAIRFMEERNKEKPFSLLVHHKAPHRNWMPEEKYLDLYEDVEFPFPATFYDDYDTRCEAVRSQEMRIDKHMTFVYDLKVGELKEKEAYKNEWNVGGLDYSLRRMTPGQRKAWDTFYSPRNRQFIEQNLQGDELVRWKYQNYLKDYLRCIKSIDDEVGRLIAYLEQEGLMDNTVIVYTSDQGFYMGEHGWFDKRFMYEESFRTPLIVRHPAFTSKGGTVSCALVQNIDYAPTYLAVAGIEKPDYMVGYSLLPLLDGNTPEDWREYLYYHYYDYPAIHQVRRHDGVRDNRYKLIHFYGEGNGKDKDINCNELYDLQNDPDEVINLYGNPEYAGIAERLQARLDKFRIEQKVDEF